jgi:hypothetical protein
MMLHYLALMINWHGYGTLRVIFLAGYRLRRRETSSLTGRQKGVCQHLGKLLNSLTALGWD